MKFIVEASFPTDTFNRLVRDGTVGKKLGDTLQAIGPEVAYFTDNGEGRGLMMIFDLDNASQVPHITEPLMLGFDAAVHYRVAMAPEELAAAGLEKYAES